MNRLQQLQQMERDATLEAMLPRLKADAKRLGIDPNLPKWDLIRAVNDANQERRRPQLEERARRLGVPTHNKFLWWIWPRDFTTILLECYDREREIELERRFGNK